MRRSRLTGGWVWTCVAASLAGLACGGGGDDTDTAEAGDVRPDGDTPGESTEAVDAPVDGEPDLPGDTEPEVPTDAADADADPDAPPDAADADADDGGPTGSPVGAACVDGEECLDGSTAGECIRALLGLTFPDGYCTALGCATADDCPGGAAATACLPSTLGFNWCADRCTAAADDCRDGYICVDPDGGLPAPSVCLPVCRTADDCEPGQVCDTAGDLPICRDAAGAANGAACASSAECAVGSNCVPEDSSFVGAWPASGPPGGICIQECLDDAACTNGGVCVLACNDQNSTDGDDCDDDGTAGLDPEAYGICMEGCNPASLSACPRSGYSCQSAGDNAGGGINVCTVDCEEGGCTQPGWECDPSAGFGSLEFGAGRCQPPFEASQLGQACTFTSGCTGGTCLAEPYAGAPGGLCIEECTGGGGGDRCPTGTMCLARAGEIGFCVEQCALGGTDCRDGWECTTVAAVFHVCQPNCTRNDQCDGGCCRADGSGYCDATHTSCL